MITRIISEQSKQRIPIQAPAAVLQFLSTTIQLGTGVCDAIEIDKSSSGIKGLTVDGSEEIAVNENPSRSKCKKKQLTSAVIYQVLMT